MLEGARAQPFPSAEPVWRKSESSIGGLLLIRHSLIFSAVAVWGTKEEYEFEGLRVPRLLPRWRCCCFVPRLCSLWPNAGVSGREFHNFTQSTDA